jgi:excisionase family DNA binding protein
MNDRQNKNASDLEIRKPSRSLTAETGADVKSRELIFGRHLLSKKELAVAIGVSARTIDNWIAQKRIPFLRLSARLIRFNLERVMTALARYEIKEIGAYRQL